MQNKIIITLSVVAVGASALGGVLLLVGGAGKTNSDGLEQSVEAAASAEPDFFASAVSSPATRERTSEKADYAPQQAQSSGRGGWDRLMSRLDEFDSDGDGVLSEAERDAMRRQLRDEWRQGMDLDGDGEISREERRQARLDRFRQSSWGQDLMRRFDADGNGVLSDVEQAAMDGYLQQQREERRAQQLEAFDTDGDGELSRDERQAQREQQRSQRDSFMDEMTREFDRDGDGQLSIEESQDAWATFQERREIDQFIDRYDYNGDGDMGAADLDAFLSDYDRGDFAADVNRDGEINSMDLAAFSDMIARSRNRP